MPSEIKPCPSCGAAPVSFDTVSDGEYWVECSSSACEMAGPNARTQEEAIAKWNRLHMLPEGVAGDFGEPWRIVRQGPWPERIEDRAHCDPLRPRHGHMDRAVECVNALANLNPEALGEFVAAVEEFSEKSEQHWRECRDKVRAALAKLKGEG